MACESPTLRNIRRFLALLVTGGILAMAVDLVLIGHYEDSNQLIPLAVAVAGVATLGWAALLPGVVAMRAVQFVMLCFIGTGLVGITLHVQANAEFQREIDPAISARDLLWKVTEATAPPALSPGFMVQLGLLGLVYTYRHPALRRRPAGRYRGADMRVATVLTIGVLLMGSGDRGAGRQIARAHRCQHGIRSRLAQGAAT